MRLQLEPCRPAALGGMGPLVAHPEDTAFVAWGHPELLLHADLTSPHPYLWSLPARTLDPDLHRLIAILRSPGALTWVVRKQTPTCCAARTAGWTGPRRLADETLLRR